MSGLSFAEKAKFYAALAEMEEKHGKEIVRELLAGMLDMSEPKVGFDIGMLDWEQIEKPKEGDKITVIDETLGINRDYHVGETKGNQMELWPVSKKKSRNNAGPRRRDGENDRLIREWLETNHPGESGSEVLLKMYYVDRLTQREIGERIGVNQRAISAVLARIPEQQRKKLIAGWAK